MWSHVCVLLIYIYIVKSTALTSETNSAEGSSLCAEDSIIDVNNLGFRLLNKSVAQPGNIFLSPLGAAWSLGILHFAAANQTVQQIEKVLSRREDSKLSPTKVQDELNHLLQTLKDTGTELPATNEVLFQVSHNISDDFSNTIEKSYYTEVKFTNGSNSEVTENDDFNRTENDDFNTTESYFENTPNEPSIEVVSSLTFNNSWKVQFLRERTERDYFYSGKRETTEVWMMSIEAETFKFYEDLEMKYKFIDLPYENGHMSMILALPTQYDQPADLQLDTKTFCKIKSKLIPTKLDMVSLPKFQFSEESSIKKQLVAMGIEDAFNDSIAEFPGISDDERVYVSDIMQKINIEVDEDGGESASLTKLKFKPVAFRGVKEFIANHPFLFYVEDKITGSILVLGRVDEPSESISFSERLHF